MKRAALPRTNVVYLYQKSPLIRENPKSPRIHAKISMIHEKSRYVTNQRRQSLKKEPYNL